jgi:hypothetical protein
MVKAFLPKRMEIFAVIVNNDELYGPFSSIEAAEEFVAESRKLGEKAQVLKMVDSW